ncbi:MAG: hypothetical protein GTO46_08020 [Gemmatimonadetes bacterium]|nr:hypothetical protein [Gemmatimonadota bacterium]NIO31602.1 hypothetical protein [Gemmatimonadota bacterium]
MECEEFLTDYSDFLDRQFEEHPIVSYCDHLLSCSDCAAYDRVMRRGLKLVRGLEQPEAQPDLVPRVGERVLSRGVSGSGGAESTRTALVAAAAILALCVVGSLAVLRSGGTTELPPLVVEPAVADELPSLWGPAPKLTPAVSLLRVPELTDDRLFRPPPERFSAFRAPLRASRRPSSLDALQTAAPE